MNLKAILLTSISSALIISCSKEIPVKVNMLEDAKDTTYVAAVEAQQEKKYLVEELSGVTCVNCPAGSVQLHDMNKSGEYANKLIILAIHSGTFTDPVVSTDINSIQDFTTSDGDEIVSNIFGGEPGKPCAGFDRLPISATAESKILDYRSRWNSMIATAKNTNSDNPVNIDITTQTVSETEYRITVKVAYTKEMTGKQGLSVYLSESGINDAQLFPSGNAYTTFDHIFRKSISPYTGTELGKDMEVKEKGRVFILTYTLNIDKNDAKEKFWKPENLELVAFVHNLDAEDKRTYQTAFKKLL